MNFEKTFGEFSNDGKSYIVTDRNTPRQWLNIMVNDRFASIAGNDGSGFTSLGSFYLRITKYHSTTDYLLRTLNGKRVIKLTDLQEGKEYDLFNDCENMKFTVKPGFTIYEGNIGTLYFSVEIFVPNEDTCECWIIKLHGENKNYLLSVSEDLAFMNARVGTKAPDADIKITQNDGHVCAVSENAMQGKLVYAVFGMKDSETSVFPYKEVIFEKTTFDYTTVMLSKKISLSNAEQTFFVVSGASFEEKDIEALYSKYTDAENVWQEYETVANKWKNIIERNYCELPDKNLQYFLNVWLKNQVSVTMRYNRFSLW